MCIRLVKRKRRCKPFTVNDPSLSHVAKLLNFDSESPRQDVNVHIEKLNCEMKCTSDTNTQFKLLQLKEKLIFYSSIIQDNDVYVHSAIRKSLQEDSKEWHNYEALRSRIDILNEVVENNQ